MVEATRIIDMPNGGGARCGLDIWFDLQTPAGVQRFCIEHDRFPHLLLGLHQFAQSAAELKASNSPAVTPSIATGRLTCAPGPDGGVTITVYPPNSFAMPVTLEPGMLKPFLAELLGALAKAAPLA